MARRKPEPPPPPPPPPEPPDHLSDRAKELWRAVVPGRARSPERLALLQTALEALDRAEQCRIELERQGLTTTTKTTGAVHMNPLLRVEKDNRQLFARLWDMLALRWNPDKDGRKFGL